jgi:DNA-binding NarL/FixJ family response regulator
MDPTRRRHYIDGVLLGRDPECARLDALVTQVRAGASTALVVTGEAGVGKTSLLEHAVARSAGLQVLRARGNRSERNLPFAALADLVRPILAHLGALPGPQREALAGALAIGPAVSADRFAICVATLSLLALATARRPVLAVVDDMHWLDAASAQVLEFTARRLDHEAVGLVIALRPGAASSFDASGLDAMAVAGLGEQAARDLLALAGRPIAPAVADRLISGTGGNPLALLELPGALTDAELTGLALLPEPLPVAVAIRQAFAQRLDTIGPAARRLLLLAACDATADLATLQRASGRLGLDLSDLPAAVQAGLVRLADGYVEFTHPLLRATAYHIAGTADRQAAHRALAEDIGADRDPVRRAWHLAAAAIGPDEDVAASLDRAADVARTRNAFVAASRAYQRAAELTADPDRQLARWMAAGQTASLGGDLTSAASLLKRVIERAVDPGTRADARLMLAHATVWTEPPAGHYDQLIADADAVMPYDKQRVATLLALASSSAIMMGRLDLALETATRAVDLADSTAGAGWLSSLASLAHASIVTGRRAAGRQAIGDLMTYPGIDEPDLVYQQLRMRCGQSLIWCEEYQLAEDMLRSTVAAGRVMGRLDDLPYALATLSDLYFRTGDWGRAYAHVTEAVELCGGPRGNMNLSYALVCAARIDAAMGAAAVCRDRVTRAVRLARPLGIVAMNGYAAAALGLLKLGTADYVSAGAELTRVATHVNRYGVADPCVIQWRPDYIEALIRLGRVPDAREQLAALEAEAARVSSPWAAAAAARCRGMLLKSSPRAISQLEEATVLAETSASPFEQARARLCLGEALRRSRRRGAAARQLERAYLTFEQLGAQPWTERTAAELAAAGVSTIPRREPIHIRLTPQELRVALQVADGLSNQEVAARLFLSHKTVEVHLGHIYDKLGVHSRTNLARLVHSGAVQQLSERRIYLTSLYLQCHAALRPHWSAPGGLHPFVATSTGAWVMSSKMLLGGAAPSRGRCRSKAMTPFPRPQVGPVLRRCAGRDVNGRCYRGIHT